MRSRADGLAALLTAVADPEAAEDLSALAGAPIVVVNIEDAAAAKAAAAGLVAGAPIVVGVDQAGNTPPDLGAQFDILLTTAGTAPAPWVNLAPADLAEALVAIEDTAAHCPIASAVYAQVLRLGDGLDFDGALAVESLAYSTLLGGREFRAWREGRPAKGRSAVNGPRLRLERQGERLDITLIRPEIRNAIGAAVRDELTEALRLALLDPSIAVVELRGEGPCFSAGGDLEEFGQAGDLALAHIIRGQRSPARLAHRLGPRLHVFIQGAAIGGGIEIAAAAGRVVADPDARFRLPEVGMGLIPGAGGTASVPARIGRHRACFMGLAGGDIDAATALGWGLADELAVLT